MSTGAFGLASHTPMDVFSAQVDAFNAHDVTAFLTTYAPDALVTSNSGVSLVGHEAMREHYTRRLSTPQLRCDVVSAQQIGDRFVVAHERVGDDETSVEVVAVFDIVDGLIRSSLLMLGEATPR
jgi:hypothetical protein